MKCRSTAITTMALLLALALVASPAFGGEPKGGSGEQAQVRSGAAEGTDSETGNQAGDVTRDYTQTRTRTQDQTCDTECVGDQLKTQTRTQTRTQATLRISDASEDATQTRTRLMLQAEDSSGTVDSEPVAVEVVTQEAQAAKQAGGLLGDLLQTMTRLADRVFLWLGLA